MMDIIRIKKMLEILNNKVCRRPDFVFGLRISYETTRKYLAYFVGKKYVKLKGEGKLKSYTITPKGKALYKVLK